jgi:serine/threonine protein kinase
MSLPPPNLPERPATSAEVTGTVSAQSGDTRTLPLVQRIASASALVTPAPAGLVLPPEPGTRVGTYVLQKKLGEGVSCHVFRGWDEALRCPVAVKIINWANVYDRPAAMKQLRTEAAALSRVSHPAVVKFLDFGFDPRWPYLVTELFDGQPLGELLRDGGALPAKWAMYLMAQMVDALGAVWRAGLVHRDIKPDNIMVGAAGAGKLIDFGLAKAEAIQAAQPPAAPEMAGTAAYLAPEQAGDPGAADFRADIYSLGATLYHALTGRLPFEGRSALEMIAKHSTTPPVPPRRYVRDLSGECSDLVMRMLAKMPEQRFASYDELRAALARAVGDRRAPRPLAESFLSFAGVI